MRQFTKEELDKLSNYEDRFNTALKLNYVRNLEPRYLNTIKDVYDSASSENYQLNPTCGHCVLTFIKVVAKKYFEDLEAYNKKAEKMVQVLDEVFGDVPENEEPKKPVVKKAPAKKTNKPKANKKR